MPGMRSGALQSPREFSVALGTVAVDTLDAAASADTSALTILVSRTTASSAAVVGGGRDADAAESFDVLFDFDELVHSEGGEVTNFLQCAGLYALPVHAHTRKFPAYVRMSRALAAEAPARAASGAAPANAPTADPSGAVLPRPPQRSRAQFAQKSMMAVIANAPPSAGAVLAPPPAARSAARLATELAAQEHDLLVALSDASRGQAAATAAVEDASREVDESQARLSEAESASAEAAARCAQAFGAEHTVLLEGADPSAASDANDATWTAALAAAQASTERALQQVQFADAALHDAQANEEHKEELLAIAGHVASVFQERAAEAAQAASASAVSATTARAAVGATTSKADERAAARAAIVAEALAATEADAARLAQDAAAAKAEAAQSAAAEVVGAQRTVRELRNARDAAASAHSACVASLEQCTTSAAALRASRSAVRKARALNARALERQDLAMEAEANALRAIDAAARDLHDARGARAEAETRARTLLAQRRESAASPPQPPLDDVGCAPRGRTRSARASAQRSAAPAPNPASIPASTPAQVGALVATQVSAVESAEAPEATPGDARAIATGGTA